MNISKLDIFIEYRWQYYLLLWYYFQCSYLYQVLYLTLLPEETEFRSRDNGSKVINNLSLSHKTPALATMLLQQLHTVDGHAPVDRFAHVINSQQSHLHCR